MHVTCAHYHGLPSCQLSPQNSGFFCTKHATVSSLHKQWNNVLFHFNCFRQKQPSELWKLKSVVKCTLFEENRKYILYFTHSQNQYIPPYICIFTSDTHVNQHTPIYIHTHTSVEHATVEKVVQETCYEVVFDDGSVCSSLPASQIIKVRIQLQFIMAWMFTDVYIVCVCVCVCVCVRAQCMYMYYSEANWGAKQSVTTADRYKGQCQVDRWEDLLSQSAGSACCTQLCGESAVQRMCLHTLMSCLSCTPRV